MENGCAMSELNSYGCVVCEQWFWGDGGGESISQQALVTVLGSQVYQNGTPIYILLISLVLKAVFKVSR